MLLLKNQDQYTHTNTEGIGKESQTFIHFCSKMSQNAIDETAELLITMGMSASAPDKHTILEPKQQHQQ